MPEAKYFGKQLQGKAASCSALDERVRRTAYLSRLARGSLRPRTGAAAACGGRSPMVKALDCDSSLCGFDSRRPPPIQVAGFLRAATTRVASAPMVSRLGNPLTSALSLVSLATGAASLPKPLFSSTHTA